MYGTRYVSRIRTTALLMPYFAVGWLTQEAACDPNLKNRSTKGLLGAPPYGLHVQDNTLVCLM
jgi:hypothetical protein